MLATEIVSILEKKIESYLVDRIDDSNQELSFQEIADALQHTGFGSILLFLCLPFIQPIPTLGLSTPMGALIAFLGLQLSLGNKSVRFPDFLGRKKVPLTLLRSVLGVLRRFLNICEKFVRPRWPIFYKADKITGIAIFLSALLLMIPIPIPLSNMMCAYPIIFLAISLIEDDGLFTLLGYLGLVFSIIFHGMIAVLGVEASKALISRFF